MERKKMKSEKGRSELKIYRGMITIVKHPKKGNIGELHVQPEPTDILVVGESYKWNKLMDKLKKLKIIGTTGMGDRDLIYFDNGSDQYKYINPIHFHETGKMKDIGFKIKGEFVNDKMIVIKGGEDSKAGGDLLVEWPYKDPYKSSGITSSSKKKKKKSKNKRKTKKIKRKKNKGKTKRKKGKTKRKSKSKQSGG